MSCFTPEELQVYEALQKAGFDCIMHDRPDGLQIMGGTSGGRRDGILIFTDAFVIHEKDGEYEVHLPFVGQIGMHTKTKTLESAASIVVRYYEMWRAYGARSAR